MDKEYCPYCMNPIKPGLPCPSCGLTEGAYTPSPHHLPPGTVLAGRYLVGRVLGEGGFGITYIGCDLRLELRVAIKEYYPGDRVNRNSATSLTVTGYTGALGKGFDAGRERFIQEARVMARMDKTPQIVAVRDFFQENNTAYIVMEYVDGTTFKELVAQKGGKISASELLPLVEPLFSALSTMHSLGLIHRDISPDNLMLENGGVRLLDFGCARESAQGVNTMTIVLKHGYSPIEQYQHKGQGPWTDVYSLSATLYYCLTGKTPPQALDRICDEELIPPRQLGADLTPAQEKAILRGMGVRRSQRYRSAEELHAALYQGVDVPVDEAGPERETPRTGTEAAWAGEPASQPNPTPAEPEEETPAAEPVPVTVAAGPEPSSGPDELPATELGPVPEPDGIPAAGPSPVPEPEDVPKTEPSPEEEAGSQEAAPQKPPVPDFLKTHRGPVIGGAAALALCAGLLIWRPWAGQPQTVDENPPGVAISLAPTASTAPGLTYSMYASDSTTLLSLLDNGTVDIITVPEDTFFEAAEPVTLTKTLRINANSSVSFPKGLTVAGGGRLEVAGGLDAPVLLRTTDGGTISVESGGALSAYMLWLEREGDLTCAADGGVDIWGGDDPTKGPIDDYARSHYRVFFEEELFANAVHVNSEEEFAHYMGGGTPIVIDSDMIFHDDYWVNAPVLIPEGVTVDAPCPDAGQDEGNCTLEMNSGSILVNHGTITGRLGLHGYSENGTDPFCFINYGTVDAALWTEMGTLINLGNLTIQEILRETALSNLGRLTLDGPTEARGNHSSNAGSLTVTREGSLMLYGGTNLTNFGSFTIEDGGRLDNSAQLTNGGGGRMLVQPGARLTNSGRLLLNAPSTLSAGAGAVLSNEGVVQYATGSLEASFGGGGRVLPYAPSIDWESWGERARWVSSESELREALGDDSCELVVWDGYSDRNKINLNSAEGLTVAKGLVLGGDRLHPVDLNASGITLSGENAFFIGDNVNFHDNGLTVENGATAVLDGDTNNLGGLTASDGMVCLLGSAVMTGGGQVELSGGSQLLNLSGMELEGCAVRLDSGSLLANYCNLHLARCDVVSQGEFVSFFGELFQEGGSFINNGDARINGWDWMVRLDGDVSNHGQLDLGGRHRVGGALVNEADGSITLDWEDAPLIVSGRLENNGRIQGASGAYVETVDGGVFTGNPVSYS